VHQPLVDDDDAPMRHAGAHPPAWPRTAQDDMGVGECPQATLAPSLPRQDGSPEIVDVFDERKPRDTREALQILYIDCQCSEMCEVTVTQRWPQRG
jgi:hypothetical protein